MDKDKFHGSIIITNREKIEVDGVEGIASFDNDCLTLIINDATAHLIIEGNGLVVDELSKASKKMIVFGSIYSLYFNEVKSKKGIKGRSM